MGSPSRSHSRLAASRGSRAAAILAGGVVLALAVLSRKNLLERVFGSASPAEDARCGAGFTVKGARCCLPNAGNACTLHAPSARRIAIPAADFTLVATDWEAGERVAPLRVQTAPFYIDVYEQTRGGENDPGQAAAGLSFAAANERCAQVFGRVPSAAEWVAAASYLGAGATISTATRYPWGNTGAVCRRAAFGLRNGPCAESAAATADSVGAHPDGRSAAGLEDLAGNVAEWTLGDDGPELRGGSYLTAFAAELRLWSSQKPPSGSAPEEAGVRCAYDKP